VASEGGAARCCSRSAAGEAGEAGGRGGERGRVGAKTLESSSDIWIGPSISVSPLLASQRFLALPDSILGREVGGLHGRRDAQDRCVVVGEKASVLRNQAQDLLGILVNPLHALRVILTGEAQPLPKCRKIRRGHRVGDLADLQGGTTSSPLDGLCSCPRGATTCPQGAPAQKRAMLPGAVAAGQGTRGCRCRRGRCRWRRRLFGAPSPVDLLLPLGLLLLAPLLCGCRRFRRGRRRAPTLWWDGDRRGGR